MMRYKTSEAKSKDLENEETSNKNENCLKSQRYVT